MNIKVFLSTICAILFAIPVYFIIRLFDEDAIWWAIISGFLFYLILLQILYIEEKIRNKHYKEVEKTVTSHIWYVINGNIKSQKDIKNANIYFTNDSIVFISLDKKPYILEEVYLQNIIKYESDKIHILNIYTKDNRLFMITSNEVRALFPRLEEHVWIK